MFSQDQDVAEVASDLCLIYKKTGGLISIACASRKRKLANNKRGVNGAEWLTFNINGWNNCLYLSQLFSPRLIVTPFS